MEHDKNYLKLTTVLFRTMQNVSTVIQKDIQSYQLNTSEFGTLELLYNRGRQPIQSIASRLLMANSSMTYVIDKLENRGFITRTADVVDKRMTMIDLTKEGRTFFDNIFPHHKETLRSIYQDLSDEELASVIELLKKVGYRAMHINGDQK
jgi:MarR family transcriptional regulator, 2-MHQ and catechol-resistance regulon repressor